MKLLLTGASGFVAPFVARAVRAAVGGNLEIVGVAQRDGHHPDIGTIRAMDLSDAATIDAVFAAHRPSHVIHLGGISAPAAAEANFELAWDVNVLGTLRCARALMAHSDNGIFLLAGSAQVYGDVRSGADSLTEDAPLAPLGEYAATKAAADLAVGALGRRGLRAIRFRPFNHTGPGQTPDFVVPRFAGQIARIEAGQQAPVIRVGNLEARRDFLDVRDVARAYATALMRADNLPADPVFNLGSGRAETIRWVLDTLVSMARAPATVEMDPTLWRSNDSPVLLADATRARTILDWRPEYTLENTLRDVLEHCRAGV